MSTTQAARSAAAAPPEPANRNDAPSAPVLAEGDAAHRLLDDADFRDKLRLLHENCPWATGYQSTGFLAVWYECYSAQFEPVVIYQLRGDRLAGFFGLARDKRDGRIVVAGDHQAEYQCWLAGSDEAETFLQSALTLLRQKYRPRTLRLKYLPMRAPIAWAKRRLDGGGRAHMRPYSRPILGFKNPEHIDQTLKKKSNKSRLNRLKRMGDVRLRRLETADELAEVIDRIGDNYDLRQGAMNGVYPFRDDPKKTAFHLKLMAEPGLLDASVLTVGDDIAAALLGLRDGGMVDVGVYSIAPFFARHSPGKFLMLLLGQELAAQGLEGIDLTPGDDWKDRFATDHERVHDVTIYFRSSDAWRVQAKESILSLGRKVLGAFGMSPADLRRRVQSSRAAEGLAPGSNKDRTRVFLGDRHLAENVEPAEGFERDRIGDLLCQDRDRQAFLGECERRLSEGHHVYTRVRDGRLVQYGWMAEAGSPGGLPEGMPGLDDATVLYDIQALPPYDRLPCLKAMLRSVALGAAKQVAIVVPNDDAILGRELEALGFRMAAIPA